MSPPSFTDLGLTDSLASMLRGEGYDTPTPIQVEAIPVILAGHDLLGVAKTGTGKTAAFALPLIQTLTPSDAGVESFKPRALILTPTRELCAQIQERICAYASGTEIRCGRAVGGVDVQEQIQVLRAGVHILVATPGRLLDLMRTRHVRLDKVGHFVLDEADRMLDMGFLEDVRTVIRALPASRQSNLFSATMPEEIVRIAGKLLTNPTRAEIRSTPTSASALTQQLYYVDRKHKTALLSDVLLDPAILKALVFTSTKRSANDIARHLRELGVRSEAIHGNKSQAMRDATMKSFRNNRIRVLVASDLAARGIDVEDVTHVFNYDLPDTPETYVHRIGRTARAGKSGTAISFCDNAERVRLRNIESYTRAVLEVVQGHAFEPRGPVGVEQFRPAGKLSPKPDKRTARHRARRGSRGTRPGQGSGPTER